MFVIHHGSVGLLRINTLKQRKNKAEHARP